MFFEMIRKTIPHSLRAFIALLVMVFSITMLYNGLTGMFVANASKDALISFIIGLIVGLPATAAFFYFQAEDQRAIKDGRLEILNAHAKRAQREHYQATIVTTNQPDHPVTHSENSPHQKR